MTTEADRAIRTPSTACIGWATDNPCPEHGDMHGCTRPDGHCGHHQCACGAEHVARRRKYRKRGTG